MKNKTALLLRSAAILAWALGGLIALWLWFRWKPDVNDPGNWAAAAVALGSFFAGLLPWALGEIVVILHDIRAKGIAPAPTAQTDPSKPSLYVEDMVSFQPPEPEPDPVLEQVESFIWVCPACGEINLSASEGCRICKAEKPKEAPKA